MAVPQTVESDPIEIATAFIACINAADISGLCELMTEDHVFQDALGKRFVGRETMRHGWQQYLAMVKNYKVYAQEYFVRDRQVAIFGTASGSYQPAGGAPAQGAEGFWEIPAAWSVAVRGTLVAEWRVYADNQPLRKLMGEAVP
ncbi:MAG: nuclear transport factor 2 family protein [Candidatus Acidiferrum sp.]